MKLNISENSQQKIANAIFISGSARSGTTIVGKIIHSLKRVEFFFEPPMLVMLFPLIEEMSKYHWMLLYETYLYEELLINSLCGRSINCNRADDSSIYKVKSYYEIQSRLNQSIRKNDVELLANQYRISYKIPNVTPFLPKLVKYYPDTRVVIVKRDAVNTISSLLLKKWFHDESLKMNVIWPFRIYKNVHIPYWVKEKDDKKWLEMSEIDRCAYYYIRINEGAERIQNKIEICYNNLVADPGKVVQKLSEKLSLEYGEKTDEIINQIKPTTAKKDFAIMEKISPNFAKLVEFYSEKSIGCAIV